MDYSSISVPHDSDQWKLRVALSCSPVAAPGPRLITRRLPRVKGTNPPVPHHIYGYGLESPGYLCFAMVPVSTYALLGALLFIPAFTQKGCDIGVNGLQGICQPKSTCDSYTVDGSDGDCEDGVRPPTEALG